MSKILNSIYLWLDAEAAETKSISWLRCIPFILTHIACFAVFWVGCSYQAVILCFFSYFIRMFAITGFYHRLFSHRSFKTSRAMQFIFAILGATAAQRGPLWWSGHHRLHHQYSDQEHDPHSPNQKGFMWSHFMWFIHEENFSTQKKHIDDLCKYPELVILNRYDMVAPLLYAITLYFIGGWQYVIWGYFISTVILYHATFCINSLAHSYGTKSFDTQDHSRNNWWLAIITLGEGWHNNHHYWPSSARQGFNYRELDITFMLLKVLAAFGLIWGMRMPPKEVLDASR